MIEADIKKVIAHQKKIDKSFKENKYWQINHQKTDDAVAGEVSEIKEAISKFPTKDEIVQAVASSVQITVNGKLDKIKEHLSQQDELIKTVGDKVEPLDGFRKWIFWFARGIMYLGVLAGAVSAILLLLRSLKLL